MEYKIGQVFWDATMFGDYHIELSKWIIEDIDNKYIHMSCTRPKCCGYGYDSKLRKIVCKEFESTTRKISFKIFDDGPNIPDWWKPTQQEAVNHMFGEIEDDDH